MRINWDYKTRLDGSTIMVMTNNSNPIYIKVDLSGGRHKVINDTTGEVLHEGHSLTYAKAKASIIVKALDKALSERK